MFVSIDPCIPCLVQYQAAQHNYNDSMDCSQWNHLPDHQVWRLEPEGLGRFSGCPPWWFLAWSSPNILIKRSVRYYCVVQVKIVTYGWRSSFAACTHFSFAAAGSFFSSSVAMSTAVLTMACYSRRVKSVQVTRVRELTSVSNISTRCQVGNRAAVGNVNVIERSDRRLRTSMITVTL